MKTNSIDTQSKNTQQILNAKFKEQIPQSPSLFSLNHRLELFRVS